MREAEKANFDRVASVYDKKTCYTARMIANKLGVTRSTVIGWYSRSKALKEHYRLDGVRKGPGRAPGQANKQPRSMGVDVLAREARMKIAAAPPIAQEEVLGKFTLLDLPSNGCKWPSGESPTMFCGEARGEDKAYCEHHRRLAVVPAKERFRSRRSDSRRFA